MAQMPCRCFFVLRKIFPIAVGWYYQFVVISVIIKERRSLLKCQIGFFRRFPEMKGHFVIVFGCEVSK